MPTPIAWAKLVANIYANRKIRQAGPCGREVFFFVLVQNAARDATGAIPVKDLEPWYVADQLLISEQQAREGIERAISAGLIGVTEHEVVICGWDEEWGKRSLTEAERKRLQRARAKSGQVSGPVTSGVRTDVTVSDSSPDCPGGEESKESKESSPSAARLAELVVAEINRLAGTYYHPDSKPTLDACRKLLKAGHTIEQILAAVVHVGKPWVGTHLHDKIRPATLLQAKRVRDAIEDIEAGRGLVYVLPSGDSEECA